MKKALSSLLVFALVLTLLVPAFAFAADKTTEEKFNELKELGLLNGVEDGSAALDRELTRAELAAILVRLFKLEPITGQSSFIDVPAEHWAQKEGVIEAVAKAGYMGSTTTYSKTFSPDAKLTIAEVATVAVRALKLTVDENAKIDGVQPWAAPYVDAALKAGLIAEATNYHANANRGILVDAAYAIYQAILKPPVTTATKVESVSATNLKEVIVKFDGEVDADSAENTENYSLSTGNAIQSATLSEDGTTVTLTTQTALKNQVAIKLSVNNIKAGNNTISVKDFVFTPIDNTLPTVVNVSSLGTKAIKVEFSEPIAKGSAYSYYKLDGNTFYGTGSGEGTRTIILKPYNSNALTIGEHKLTVNAVEDFYGFKSLSSEHSFTVVEDKEAPTIKSVSATLEYVKVTFSEEVDPDTVKANNVYWKSGSTLLRAKSVDKISADTYGFDFSGRELPSYATVLYVEGVKDYSGNALAQTTVEVTAQIDSTRPEVKSIELADTNDSFTVVFTKAIDGGQDKVDYFKLTDKDGKVVGLKNVTYDGTKALVVHLYSPLKDGTYTVTVSGIKDATKLHNTMLDYTQELVVDSSPIISAVSYNAADRTVVITFSKEMDLTTTTSANSYLMNYKGVWRTLPSDAGLTAIQGGYGVLIQFQKELGSDKNVTLGQGSIEQLRVFGVKDLDGRALSPVQQFDPIDFTNTLTPNIVAHPDAGNNEEAVAYDKNTIEVKFNQGISRASTSDFEVKVGNTVLPLEDAVADFSDVVTLKIDSRFSLPTDLSGVTVRILEGNSLLTAANEPVLYGDPTDSTDDSTLVRVYDLIKPELDTNTLFVVTNGQGTVGSDVYYAKIDITFSEVLDNARADLFAHDLVVKRDVDGRTLTADSDYVTTSNGKVVTIYLKKQAADSYYYIQVADGARYIKDVNGNKAVKSSSIRTTNIVDTTP